MDETTYPHFKDNAFVTHTVHVTKQNIIKKPRQAISDSASFFQKKGVTFYTESN